MCTHVLYLYYSGSSPLNGHLRIADDSTRSLSFVSNKFQISIKPTLRTLLQVVTGSAVPPGHGGLRASRYTDTVGAQSAILRAGEEMQPCRDRVSVAGHRVHD